MEELLARLSQNLWDRLGGPLSFRFVLQPLMALLLGVRAGLADGRAGRPPFLWSLFTNRDARGGLLREAWTSVATVFVVAVLIDLVYQLVVLRWFYPLESLIVAFALACVPYVLVRGPISRIVR